MTLIRQAYPNSARRARAVTAWAMGGAVAATSDPVIGGWLVLLDWRWIFFVNLPIGLVTLLFLACVSTSPRRPSPFDFTGQVTIIVAMTALIYGTIEAGAQGLSAPPVYAAFALALVAFGAFVWSQRYGANPMVPTGLLTTPNTRISMLIGFTFMVGYFGLPFVISLYLQQQRGLSAPETGLAFLPMMLIGLTLTPFSASLAQRFSARRMIVIGLGSMAVGLAALSILPDTTPAAWIAGLMVLVGLAGPFVAPPVAAVLLSSVPGEMAGTASGMFNTSRQVGGALAVALFGAFLSQASNFMVGMRISLLLAAGLALMTGVLALRLRSQDITDGG